MSGPSFCTDAVWKRSPEATASFPSLLSFSWVTPLVVKGSKKTLEEDDVWDLVDADKCEQIVPKFERVWRRELGTSKLSSEKSSSQSENGQEEIDDNNLLLSRRVTTGDIKKKPSLLKVLLKVYWTDIFTVHLMTLFKDILIFLNPILLRLLIEFTDNGRTDREGHAQTWRGYSYAAAIFFTTSLMAILEQQCAYRSCRIAMRIRASLVSAVYKKSLTMNNLARKESTVGEIINLMSVDAQRVEMVLRDLWAFWSCPLQILLAVYFLYQAVGPSVFAGLAVIIVLIPINAVIAAKSQTYQEEQMTHKDGRIKLMNEILNGIKVLKLNAWELSFRDKVLAIRNKELGVIRKEGLLQCLGIFSGTLAPYLVSLATFSTYIYTSSDHYLSAEKAFVAISLFNILRFVMNLTPFVITNAVQSLVSVRRLTNFLCHDDLDWDSVQHSSGEGDGVVIENGTFTWEPNQGACLIDANVRVEEGGLVAVVGQVGAGKSSLLSAMLGEMNKLCGRVNIKGRVAYVPQQAWIQNATLRDNILFGSELRSTEYNRILEACALGPDLDILPGKDLTEIGEKGINLSGGQKQRVSLARAVYNNADVYLMDDPLSAVDSHVGKHIFDHVISSQGLLKDKTRILVTQGVHWLPRVDKILVLVEGQISEVGSYDELMSHDGAFAQFLKTYLMEKDEEEVDDDEVVVTQSKMLDRLRSVTSNDGHDKDHSQLRRRKNPAPRSRSIPEDIDVLPDKEAKSGAKGPNPRAKKSPSRTKGSPSPAKDPPPQDEKPPLNEDTVLENKDRLIEEETSEQGSVGWKIYLAYFRALGILYTLLLVSLYAFYQVGMIYSNIWLSQWTVDPVLINRSLPADSPVYREKNDYYLVVYGGLGIGQGFFVLLFSVLMAIRMTHVSAKLHTDLLTNVLRSPMAFFDTTPVGRILNRFSKDIESVDEQLPGILLGWTDSLCYVLSSLIAVSYSTPIFLSVVVPLFLLYYIIQVRIAVSYSTPIFLSVVAPLFVLYYIIQRFYVSTSRQLKRLESKTRSPIFSHFSETISGTSVIRAFGAEERFIREQEEKVDHSNGFHMAGVSANRWLGLSLQVLCSFIVLAAGLFAVSERGSIQGGLVGLSISYALQITSELTWLVRMTSELQTNIVSVERINEYTNTPTEAQWYDSDRKPPSDWPGKGVIRLENYATRYRPGLNLVLKGIAANINAGEKIGIVGRTGAGKSSLTLSLFRLIEPAGGAIIIDGRDVTQMGLHDLRSRLTILPQEPLVFSGTLRMNLDPFDLYSNDRIWQALEHAHLKSFVEGLPERLQHECGEGGQNLSVGQRQLVCLARTLLRKTRILILDEATAAVDMETDDLIQATIREEFKDCTILTIAHRLNTVMAYDRILVLDNGLISEFDSPTVLLQNREGLFYSLAKNAGLV